MTGMREKPEREQSFSMLSRFSPRSMQIMSVRGTMISRVSVSESVSTLRSISETSGSKSFASTRRSMVARPCSSWSFSSSSSSDKSSPCLLDKSFCPPILANGVSAAATETALACCSMMSTGLEAPALRGRTSSDTTATISANTNPASNCAHKGTLPSIATTATSTPSMTLQAMRKNAHDPAVAYRSEIRCCTLEMRRILLSRMNGESSESVCTSRMRLFRLARVTLPTAPSAAAIANDSQTNSIATTTNTAIIAMVVVSIFTPPFVPASKPVRRYFATCRPEPCSRSHSANASGVPAGSEALSSKPWRNAKNVSSSWRWSPNICRSCSLLA